MVSRPQHIRARLVALPSPTLAQADDATLARAASSGDPRATSVLWDRFSPLVRRMLRRTLGPTAEVEALLQEVFLRAAPARRPARGGPAQAVRRRDHRARAQR